MILLASQYARTAAAPRRRAQGTACGEFRDHSESAAALRTSMARFEGREGDLASWQPLHELIQRQHWRLAHFRVAADDINYRRFFNINDLAGLRMELPEVFDHAHQRVLRLVREGVARWAAHRSHRWALRSQGLPEAPVRAAWAHAAPRAPFYLVVEKILSPHERLREDWPIHGTTGYDFLNQVLSLLVDPAAETAFTDCYVESPASDAAMPTSPVFASSTSWRTRWRASST